MKTALTATLLIAALAAVLSLGVAGLMHALFSIVRRLQGRGRSGR